MKRRILYMISIVFLCLSSFGQVNYNCKIEPVRKAHENLNNLSNEIIKEFLLTFHKDCESNVEYSEFSNETLFEVLKSNPALFMDVMRENKRTIQYQVILMEIENPVSDNIDLKAVKAKIETLKSKDQVKAEIIKAIDTAINKDKN